MAGSDIETLRYAFGECALGTFPVALSDVGVAALQLGDCSADLLAGLDEGFRAARLEAAA